MIPLSQPFDQFIESPESKQLASTLAVELKQHLKLQRFSPLYEYHLTKIILNLFQAWSSNPDKCVAISRRKNFYDERSPSSKALYVITFFRDELAIS